MASSQQIQAGVQVALGPNGAEALVAGLLSADGDQRAQSERVLDALRDGHPNECVIGLMRILRQSGGAVERSLCATLLRKLLTKSQPPLWPNLTDASQGIVKTELLNVMQEEKDRAVLRQTGDLVAELISKVLGYEAWSQVIPFLMHSIASGIVLNMEIALLMLADMVEGIKDGINSELDQYCSALASCLDHTEVCIKLAALKALKAFIVAFDEEPQRAKFQPAATLILNVPEAVVSEANDSVNQAYSVLIELAEECPEFWLLNLQDVAKVMVQNSKSPHYTNNVQLLPIEFLLVLMEAIEEDASEDMVRALQTVLPDLLAVQFEFMLDVEDHPKWHSADGEEHQDEGHHDRFMFGEMAIDRIASLVGGKVMMAVTGQMLPAWLGDQDWKKRHAVFTCIGQMAEGCADELPKDINTLVSICTQGCQDSHPKVRWAACQATGLLINEVGEDIKADEAITLVKALYPLFRDKANPRVQAHAILSMVDFVQDCELEALQPCLGDVIAAVVEVLPGSPALVRDASLKFLSSAAEEMSSPNFTKYYADVMVSIHKAMAQAANEKSPALFAQMLNTMAKVGEASSESCFHPDCTKLMGYYKDVVQAVVHSSESDEEKRDIFGVLHDTAGIVCECMGREFREWLPLVMPSLMQAVKSQPHVKVCNAADTEEDSERLEIIEMAGKLMAVDIDILDYKAEAIKTITSIAGQLREDFIKNVTEVAEHVTPLVNYTSSKEVCQAAIEAQPALLRCTIDASETKAVPSLDVAFVKGLVGVQWGALVQNLTNFEKCDSAATVPTTLDAVGKIIEMLGSHNSEEMIGSAVETIKQILSHFDDLRKERKQSQTEELDKEELQSLEEELELELSLYDGLETFVGAVLKTLSDRAMAWVETILPHLTPLLDKQQRPELRQMIVILTTDICEYAPTTSQKYVLQLLPIYLDGCSSDHPGLKQCCAFGVGILAQKHEQVFKPAAGKALAQLMEMINHPDACTEDQQSATDNAISAIGKIIEYHSDVVDTRLIADTWLRFLPLKSDQAEAVIVHDQLVRMLEKKDVKVLGEANQNLPQVVPVMMGVLAGDKKLVSRDGAQRMAGLLKQMQNGVPQDVVQGTFDKMSPQEQENLKSIMAGQN